MSKRQLGGMERKIKRIDELKDWDGVWRRSRLQPMGSQTMTSHVAESGSRVNSGRSNGSIFLHVTSPTTFCTLFLNQIFSIEATSHHRGVFAFSRTKSAGSKLKATVSRCLSQWKRYAACDVGLQLGPESTSIALNQTKGVWRSNIWCR